MTFFTFFLSYLLVIIQVFNPVIHFIGDFFLWLFFAIGILLVVFYFIPYFMYWSMQDLKTKYNTEWTLVTGASTGLGKAISKRLAIQGLNIILVALPDSNLHSTCENLKRHFPNQHFIEIGVDLSQGDYISTILDCLNTGKSINPAVPVTELSTVGFSVTPNIVFLNAGYFIPGPFLNVPLHAIIKNFECNAACVIKLLHVLSHRMINNLDKKDNIQQSHSLFVVTSSTSAYLPSPLTSLYSASKACISQLVASTSVELKPLGIDITAVHPGAILDSDFQKDKLKLDAVSFAEKLGLTCHEITRQIFIVAGRTILYDISSFSLIARLSVKILPPSGVPTMMTWFSPLLSDMRKLILNNNSINRISPENENTLSNV